MFSFTLTEGRDLTAKDWREFNHLFGAIPGASLEDIFKGLLGSHKPEDDVIIPYKMIHEYSLEGELLGLDWAHVESNCQNIKMEMKEQNPSWEDGCPVYVCWEDTRDADGDRYFEMEITPIVESHLPNQVEYVSVETAYAFMKLRRKARIVEGYGFDEKSLTRIVCWLPGEVLQT